MELKHSCAPLVSGFSCSTCLWDWIMPLCIVGVYSLYWYAFIYSFLTDIGLLQFYFIYEYSYYGHPCTCLWWTYILTFLDPDMELLDNGVGVCLAFQCSFISLHAYHQCMTISSTPSPHQYLLLRSFFLVILVYMPCNLIVVLIIFPWRKIKLGHLDTFFCEVSI